MSSKTSLTMSVMVMTVCALAALSPLATAVPTASLQTAERTAGVVERRVGPENAIGGLTAEEVAAQQVALRTRLVAEMPQGALDAPVRVEITQTDRDELALPPVNGTPLRIGVVKQISPAIGVVPGGGLEPGVMQETEAGGFVWAVTVTSPGAQAIRVHFTNFSLPPDTEMYFFSLEDQAYGPHLGVGRNGNGDFWTRTISSDTGVIQLRYSGESARAALREISFEVSELGHIAGRVPSSPERTHDTWPCSSNVWCLVDAKCVSGTPADPAKRAIAKMEWVIGMNIYTCSGGLLADADPGTQIPYFLTANHCTSTSIANLETWFNYTTDSCNGVCPHNRFTGGGPPSDTIGFTLVASSPSSDATLGTLNQPPPAGSVFLGWNAAPVAFTNGAPLSRISNPNWGPQVYQQQSVNSGTGTCGALPRGNFIYSTRTNGSQMGGSSGAPVVNSASEVVGQLYGCCGSNCGDYCDFASNQTVDGAFAATWCSVADFLDPGHGCCSDSQCDDGNLCNGAETCDLASGACQPGTPPPCAEGKSEQLSSLDHWNDDAVSGIGEGGPPAWSEDFEPYALGSSLHNQGGWRGWDGSAAWTAYVTDVQSHSPVQSVDIVGGSDLVHEHSGYTAGEWTYAAWMYVPDNFLSGGTDARGSYFILLNTYNETGPYEWSVQLHADSDTDTFIRDGVIPASVPLVTGRWVKLYVLIDLNNDLYQVLYDGVELGVAESWTAGIFNEGGGVLNIGAVDLFANGSSSVYWDDVSLVPGFPTGACCYESQGYPVCVETSELDCCCLEGIFQGLDTTCPTGNVTTASHVSTPFTHLTDPARQCSAGFPPRGGCLPGDPIDPWMTPPDVDNCHQFGIVPGSPPIPADFFGPGSDPFDGFVCLNGVPLGETAWGYYETADTLVRRSADPFDRCDVPSAGGVTVDVEIVALSLRSVAPVTVTYNGGQNPESWDATVDLSEVVPPPGTITAVKTHCNGGTYESTLPVQPRFTFTKVGDPGQVLVLDTGLEGIPYITLLQEDNPPWSSDVSEDLGLSTLYCTDFHPSVDDPDPATDCDCNANAVRDSCDIESGYSPDDNGDGVPDECALVPPALPSDETHQVRKHRYISINATTNRDADTSIKVEIAEMNRCQNDLRRSCVDDQDCPTVCAAEPDLHSCGDGSICPDGVCIDSGPCGPHPNVGLSWYVQQPQTRGADCPNGMCDEEDYYARVGPDLYVSDWKDECEDARIPGWTGGCATLHIGDCEIVPGVRYNVYACDRVTGTLCSDPLEVETTRRPNLSPHYGDTVGVVDPNNLCCYGPPDGYTNIHDVSAYQRTKQNWGTTNPPQAHPTWVTVHGATSPAGQGIPPNYILGVEDLFMILRAWIDAWPYENTLGGLAPGDCP